MKSSQFKRSKTLISHHKNIYLQLYKIRRMVNIWVKKLWLHLESYRSLFKILKTYMQFHSKTERKVQISHRLPALLTQEQPPWLLTSLSLPPSPPPPLPHTNYVPVTISEPTMTHYHSKSTDYNRVHSWTVYVSGQMDNDMYPALQHYTWCFHY